MKGPFAIIEGVALDKEKKDLGLGKFRCHVHTTVYVHVGVSGKKKEIKTYL